VRPEAWDALRVGSEGPFALASDRAGLERQADERPELETRARAIDAWLAQRGVATLASYGAGAAVLELWLLRLRPDRRLVLTDYAPATVERLAGLLPEARVLGHDLLADAPVEGADLHMFHRIDTEFTNAQWRTLLRGFADREVLIVATEVIGWGRARDELLKRLRSRHVSRAGWVRNRAAFEALWRPTHEAEPLRFADLDAWLLRPRGRA